MYFGHICTEMDIEIAALIRRSSDDVYVMEENVGKGMFENLHAYFPWTCTVAKNDGRIYKREYTLE